MAGYGELLQTMAAIVIFGLILMSANRMIQRNTMMQVEGELEQEVVAVAQDIIEEGRTLAFDENSQAEIPPAVIPENFTAPSDLGHDGPDESDENDRRDFDDFDDFHGWDETVETEHGEFLIETEVVYVDSVDYDEINERSTFKKIRVNITNEFLKKNNSDAPTNYYLEFIRNYYAD